MKYKNFPWSIVFIVLIAIAVIGVGLYFVIKSNANMPEKTAEAILEKTYNATPQDYDSINNAINSSQNDNTVLFNYLQTFYGSGVTENCFNDFCKNRILYRAEKIAHEENSNIKVSSIKLEPTDAEAGSKRFTYIVLIQTTNDATKTFTFKGAIKLIQESGHWKADAMT